MANYETNAALDARVGIQSLMALAFMSPIDIEEATGIPRATAGRILRREVGSPRDVSGLTSNVIRELFQTDSGIALELQLIERDLRMAREGDLDGKISFGLLLRATDSVQMIAERPILRKDDLDTLAFASSRALIALYNSENRHLESARIAQLNEAYDQIARHFALISRIFAMEDTTSDVEKLLGLRMLLNAFFAAWGLDDLERNSGSYPRAKAAARLIASPDVIQRARNIARKIGDPRLSYQMSEAAALIGQHYTAAGLLGDAIRITGHDEHNPLEWMPPWLSTPIWKEPHFAEPIRFLVERKVNIRRFSNENH